MEGNVIFDDSTGNMAATLERWAEQVKNTCTSDDSQYCPDLSHLIGQEAKVSGHPDLVNPVKVVGARDGWLYVEDADGVEFVLAGMYLSGVDFSEESNKENPE
ncbi:hypothetical protein DRO66_03750 [Candidatus Bathyarchaeota archaeon]|nr:MAG: hypothetical protein DRO66_03750 [Candidatus Bathyarchaeota archaeon]